jgi:hemerythrin superfamily protein
VLMKKILAEILKDEHKIILSLFNELLFEEVNTEQRTIKFALVQFSLLEHLKKEDKYLYPKLRELEGTDQLGVQFSNEMRKISKQIMTFFNKYQPNSHGMVFSRELGIIVATLKSRILKEEESLLPKFERMISAGVGA